MTFDVSGVSVNPLVPFLVAYVVSLVGSTGGVSGAFLLLPFQVSVLGFTNPAVTPTNHLFNVIGIPGGVYRYWRERRMLWALAMMIVIGTIPGVVIGSWLRMTWLLDPGAFRLFIGFVLALIGLRMLLKVTKKEAQTKQATQDVPFHVEVIRFTPLHLDYSYAGESYRVGVPGLFAFTCVIGVIGGAYGVGGGAIIAPFLVSMWKLPVHTIAGATLLGTLVTSLVAVLFFTVAGAWFGLEQVSPDWLLGGLLGLGGVLGMYTGARLQQHLPSKWIESVLAVCVTGLAISYIVRFFISA